MNILFSKKTFQIAAFILFIELVSLAAYTSDILLGIFFVIAVSAYIYLTNKDIRYGLYILLAELSISSFGYLFSLQIQDFRLSIRIAFFGILLLFWIAQRFGFQKLMVRCRQQPTLWWARIFLVFILIGIINGIARGNALSLIYNDANGYLFILLLPAAFDILLKKEDVYEALQYVVAGITAVSIKILALLYIFSHFIPVVNEYVYRWVRDTGIGEITRVSLENTFHRIFLQSQVVTVVFLFIFVALLMYGIKKYGWVILKHKKFISICILAISSLLISFSRSFWLGVAVSGVLFILWMVGKLMRRHFTGKDVFRYITSGTGLIVASIALILIITNFPYPMPGSFGFNDLTDRAKSSFSDEAAISSRWNLLPPLMDEAKSNLFLGSGFGTTVTYNSNDPRIKNEENPEGIYQTSTFEWGYLDTVTEIGIIGLLTFFMILVSFYREALTSIIVSTGEDYYLILGCILGMTTLIIIHFFSPYFNHPLGIGLLTILYATVYVVGKENASQASVK